jgi:hypothetical protein
MSCASQTVVELCKLFGTSMLVVILLPGIMKFHKYLVEDWCSSKVYMPVFVGFNGICC